METVIKAERSTLGMLRLVGPCGCAIEVVPALAAEFDPATMARWDGLVDHVTQHTPCGDMRPPARVRLVHRVVSVDLGTVPAVGWPTPKVGEGG